MKAIRILSSWILCLMMLSDTVVAFRFILPTATIRPIGCMSHGSAVTSHPGKGRLPVFLSTTISKKLYSTSSNDSLSSEKITSSDSVVLATSKALRNASWFSWWSQVILTTVSTVTLLFARSVLSVTNPSQLSGGGSGGFFLAGSGIVLSSISVFWTWGGARLSRRLTRRTDTSRIQAANLLRRTINVGTAINLFGMLVTLTGAEAIIGGLAAKVLTSQGLASPLSMAAAPQLLQPLDILVVQANTNTLLSHFLSLASLLYLTRWVNRLDPPSTEEE